MEPAADPQIATSDNFQQLISDLENYIHFVEGFILSDETRGVLLHLKEAHGLLAAECAKSAPADPVAPATEPAPASDQVPSAAPEDNVVPEPAPAPVADQPVGEAVNAEPATTPATDQPTNTPEPGSPEAALAGAPNELQQPRQIPVNDENGNPVASSTPTTEDMAQFVPEDPAA